MPHITLEYTSNLPEDPDFASLFEAMHETLVDIAGIRLGNCKSRVTVLDRFYVANGAPDEAFVHLSVRFLEGRTPATRRKIGMELLDLLKVAYKSAFDRFNLQITVEIGEIDRAMYFKWPEGSIGRQGCQGGETAADRGETAADNH